MPDLDEAIAEVVPKLESGLAKFLGVFLPKEKDDESTTKTAKKSSKETEKEKQG